MATPDQDLRATLCGGSEMATSVIDLSATLRAGSEMATSVRDLSATLLGGSDITYDYYCESCLEDGQDIEARGFCQQCSAYLCDTCICAHKKNPSSKQHTLLDAATMPCMVFKDVAIDTDRLVAMATAENPYSFRDDEENAAYKARTAENIKSARLEMDKLLDDAEKRALQRVDELYKENTEKMKSASQKCQLVLSEATTMAADLEKKSREGHDSKLFVAMLMAGRRLPAMEEEIGQLKARKISHYKFDNIVQQFRSTLSTMFSVTVTTDGAGTKARHVGDVNIKTADDNNDCQIEGIATLSGDRLVVTDSENRAVKLVDVRQNKVTSRLVLSSRPLDVTRTRPDQVAVALGKERKIEIFTVTDILTRTKTIDVSRQGFPSLCFYKDTFILAYERARAVTIVDMSGRAVSTVYTDSVSNPLFKTPSYITLDKDVVFITDWEANTVTCMTLTGRVIWVYKHAEHPLGVVVGRGGAVMVCSRDTHAVQLLSRSGQLVQVLLDKQRGLPPHPGAISACEDKLWVSSLSGEPKYKNYVSMFQLD